MLIRDPHAPQTAAPQQALEQSTDGPDIVVVAQRDRELDKLHALHFFTSSCSQKESAFSDTENVLDKLL